MCLILRVGAHMPAAAQRKHEIKHKLSCSGNSDVCINLPHWDSVAPASATQVNFGSATPQLLHQREGTQVSAAEEDGEEIQQRQWNHTEKMAQLKPCAVKTKLEPAQAVCPSHTSPCPDCPGMAQILHSVPVPCNRSELTSLT